MNLALFHKRDVGSPSADGITGRGSLRWRSSVGRGLRGLLGIFSVRPGHLLDGSPSPVDMRRQKTIAPAQVTGRGRGMDYLDNDEKLEDLVLELVDCHSRNFIKAILIGI